MSEPSVETLLNEIHRMYQKLEAKTLHMVYCSADPNGPVGVGGCSCPLGREIKGLRYQLEGQLVSLADDPMISMKTTSGFSFNWMTMFEQNIHASLFSDIPLRSSDREAIRKILIAAAEREKENSNE
jgi:hypothetical protein